MTARLRNGNREAIDASHRWGLFKKSARFVDLVLTVMLLVNHACNCTQQEEAAALDK
jgi:hypothetical protein